MQSTGDCDMLSMPVYGSHISRSLLVVLVEVSTREVPPCSCFWGRHNGERNASPAHHQYTFLVRDKNKLLLLVPMSIQVISADVAALSDSVKTTFQLIGRLSKLNFQPGSTPLDEQHGDVRLELAQDIRDSLKQNEDSLETLKQEADHLIKVAPAAQRRRDSIKDRERARIAAQVARLEEDLKQ